MLILNAFLSNAVLNSIMKCAFSQTEVGQGQAFIARNYWIVLKGFICLNRHRKLSPHKKFLLANRLSNSTELSGAFICHMPSSSDARVQLTRGARSSQDSRPSRLNYYVSEFGFS